MDGEIIAAAQDDRFTRRKRREAIPETCFPFLSSIRNQKNAILVQIKTSVLLAPAIVALIRYPGLPARNRYRFTLGCRHLNLPQQRHYLLRRRSLLRHVQAAFQASFYQTAW